MLWRHDLEECTDCLGWMADQVCGEVRRWQTPVADRNVGIRLRLVYRVVAEGCGEITWWGM
eukprot:359204-Alexandrium_andersonii.AAC.1